MKGINKKAKMKIKTGRGVPKNGTGVPNIGTAIKTDKSDLSNITQK